MTVSFAEKCLHVLCGTPKGVAHNSLVFLLTPTEQDPEKTFPCFDRRGFANVSLNILCICCLLYDVENMHKRTKSPNNAAMPEQILMLEL